MKLTDYHLLSQYTIRFDPEKDRQLRLIRQVSFEEIIGLLAEKSILADIQHYSQRYPHQRLLVVYFRQYVYVVPYVINYEKKEIWLKTIFPSRKLKKEMFNNEKFQTKTNLDPNR